MQITDKQGNHYEGIKINLCEWLRDQHELGLISMTSESIEVKELIKKLKYKQTATDYMVLSFNWGDNEEYAAHLYPGDIVIRQSGKWVPYCGEQVNQFFNIGRTQ